MSFPFSVHQKRPSSPTTETQSTRQRHPGAGSTEQLLCSTIRKVAREGNTKGSWAIAYYYIATRRSQGSYPHARVTTAAAAHFSPRGCVWPTITASALKNWVVQMCAFLRGRALICTLIGSSADFNDARGFYGIMGQRWVRWIFLTACCWATVFVRGCCGEALNLHFFGVRRRLWAPKLQVRRARGLWCSRRAHCYVTWLRWRLFAANDLLFLLVVSQGEVVHLVWRFFFRLSG